MGAAEVIGIVVLIVPGLMAVGVRDFFVPMRRRVGLEQTAEAVFYSLAAYALALQATWCDAGLFQELLGPNASAAAIVTRNAALLLLTAIATAAWLGAVCGKVAATRTAEQTAARIAGRTIIPSVWQDLFHAVSKMGGRVRVECKLLSGGRICGLLDTVGVEPDDRDFVLEQPIRVDQKGQMSAEGLAVLVLGKDVSTISVIRVERDERRDIAGPIFVVLLVAWPLLIAIPRLLAEIGL